MKKYTLLLLVLVGSLGANAQTFSWIDGEETGFSLNPAGVSYLVCVAEDQTVWFAGMKDMTLIYNQMMGDNFLIRYDAQGNRQADYLIAGTLVINAMESDPGGHIYISGDFMEEDIHFWDGTVLHWDGNSINTFVARINDQGTVDWAVNLNTLRGEYSPVTDMVYRNGKLYLANSVWMTSFISILDAAGNFSVLLTETDVGSISGIDLDTEGNLYATGSCAQTGSLFNGVNFPSPGFYNRYLVKYNPGGIPEWVSYSIDVTCVQPKVRVDKDNNIYWTGLLTNSCYFDTIPLQGPSWVYDFFLVKMNPQGSALWAREVPQVLTGDASVGSLDIIKVLPDNSVTIGGYIRGMIDWGNGVITDAGSMNNEAWMLNYSSGGIPQWGKSATGSYSEVKSMDADLAGDLYITGMAHDTVHFDALSLSLTSFYFPYIVKLESSGTTGIRDINITQSISVIPNPAGDHIGLSVKGGMAESADIVDLSGRRVARFSNTDRMDISSLAPGMYYIRVQLADGSFLGTKVVKR